MSSIKKFNNSNLSSSNMVNARREEAEKLERQRLEINRKLEHLMKKYARVTGDKKVAKRVKTVGYAPNDWTPAINASGEKSGMKAWILVLVTVGVALLVALALYSVLVINDINVVEELNKIVSRFIQPV